MLASLLVKFVQILDGKLPQLLLNELREVGLLGLLKQLNALDMFQLFILLNHLLSLVLLLCDGVHL